MQRLRGALRGPVLAPDDWGYDGARATFNAMIDRRPAAIAWCAGIDDVVAAVDFAGRAGLPVAIRGGGHSVAGHAVCDGGLMIDLRLMHQVRVDPESRRLWVGGGATWRDVDTPCAAHRLAIPGGTVDSTGVAGLTLGGGIGYLIGLHGLTLDNLASAEVALADGSVVTASESAHADLFWALRGGGGNFGVVTEFEFVLHPLPAVWGGWVSFAQPHLGDAVRLFRDVMESAPDELTLMVTLGDGEADVLVCFAGDAAAGEESVGPLREQLPVLRDQLGLTSYLQIQAMLGEVPVFGSRNYWKSHFVRALPDDLIDEIVEHYLAHPQDGEDETLIEPMHGAARRVPPDATAFSRRDALVQRQRTWRAGRTPPTTTSTSTGREGPPLWWRHTRPAPAAISTTEHRTSRSSASGQRMATPPSSGCATSSSGTTPTTCFASTTTSRPPRSERAG